MILAVFAGVAASSLVLTFLRVFSMAGSSYQGQQRPPSTHWIPPKVTELHRYPLRYVSPSAVTNPHLSPDRLWASPRSSTSSSSSKASKASKASSCDVGSCASVGASGNPSGSNLCREDGKEAAIVHVRPIGRNAATGGRVRSGGRIGNRVSGSGSSGAGGGGGAGATGKDPFGDAAGERRVLLQAGVKRQLPPGAKPPSPSNALKSRRQQQQWRQRVSSSVLEVYLPWALRHPPCAVTVRNLGNNNNNSNNDNNNAGRRSSEAPPSSYPAKLVGAKAEGGFVRFHAPQPGFYALYHRGYYSCRVRGGGTNCWLDDCPFKGKQDRQGQRLLLRQEQRGGRGGGGGGGGRGGRAGRGSNSGPFANVSYTLPSPSSGRGLLAAGAGGGSGDGGGGGRGRGRGSDRGGGGGGGGGGTARAHDSIELGRWR